MTSARVFAALTLSATLLAGCMSQPAAPTGGPGFAGVQGQAQDDLRQRCDKADWRATGYRHGVSGLGLPAFSTLQKKCGQVGLKVDRLAYATGRLEGLKRYCTAQNGYDLARSRRLPEGDTPCPPELAEAFMKGVAAARVN